MVTKYLIIKVGTPFIFYNPIFVLLYPIFLFFSLKIHIEFYIPFNKCNQNISKWRVYKPQKVLMGRYLRHIMVEWWKFCLAWLIHIIGTAQIILLLIFQNDGRISDFDWSILVKEGETGGEFVQVCQVYFPSLTSSA